MSLGELAFIDRLRVLATHPAARGLDDDAAVLGDLVLTHDMIAEGVHFLPSDPPASVGWKLVTVNLSDLAGKGAEPVAALMGFTLGSEAEWDERFLAGVAAACETYGLALVGGDTIALPKGAPRVFGLTAIGRGGENIPSRSGGTGGRRACGWWGCSATPPPASLSCRPTRRLRARWSKPIAAPCRSSPSAGCSRRTQTQ